jgi:hypothetical protein
LLVWTTQSLPTAINSTHEYSIEKKAEDFTKLYR